MPYVAPKITNSSYVSYFFSGYNAWFRELGYPLLDVVIHDDGEWGIIQAHSSPVIPYLTKWSWVVPPSHVRPLSFGACKAYTDQCDLEKRWIWAQLEREEEERKQELRREEAHMVFMQQKMYEAVRKNPALMERLARHGPKVLNLADIRRNIPKHHFRKDHKKNGLIVDANVRDRPVASGQDLSAGVGSEAPRKSGSN